MCSVKSMWELRWSSSAQSRWLLRREAMAASRKKAAFSAVGARSSLWFWSCSQHQGEMAEKFPPQVNTTRQLPAINIRCGYTGFYWDRKGGGAQWNETFLTLEVAVACPPGALIAKSGKKNCGRHVNPKHNSWWITTTGLLVALVLPFRKC